MEAIHYALFPFMCFVLYPLMLWNLNFDRLAGAALICPVVNYWWSGFPANLSHEAYKEQLAADQWAVRVAHYAPWLMYWWNTQKLFPPSNVIAHNPAILSPTDKKLLHSNFQARQFYEVICSLKSCAFVSSGLVRSCVILNPIYVWYR